MVMLLFCLVGCRNSKIENKNDSLVVYFNGKQVKLETENQTNRLNLNKPNKIKLILTNLECDEIVMIGIGIKTIGNDFCNLEINPKPNDLVKEKKFELKIGFYHNNERIYHTFKIPVADN